MHRSHELQPREYAAYSTPLLSLFSGLEGMEEEAMRDPTAIPIEFDPRTKRMSGVAYHGNTPFDVPFISHIEGNLWVGGCETGLILPKNILHVVSLYPWERYKIGHKIASESYHYFYDADVPDAGQIRAVADYVRTFCLSDAPTLLHCQAGLNRSNLIAAVVLIDAGRTAEEAIALLREKRSPAVLCNRKFSRWLGQYERYS